MNGWKLHMIGNAHLDLAWLWRWHEGMREGKSTMRSVLDRIKDFDGFIFTASTAALFEWIETNDPSMFEEIRHRVEEGRIALVGGWWVEPDCNAPCGESFVRQGLYGQRYYKEKFGKYARTAYNLDSFGHSGSLPQIFKKSGLDNYVMMRPMSHEKGLPSHLFAWESDDGSRVLCFRVLYEYLSWDRELSYHIERCGAELNPSMPNIMCMYGVGNHGGGPTVENIKSIMEAANREKDYQIVFSSTDAFFSDAAGHKNLPVIHGELLHHSSGCYSAHTAMKRWNRQCENSLLLAEKAGVVARHSLNRSFQGLDKAWKRTLFNQFHDILAGTCLKSAYDDAFYMAGAAICDAQEVTNQAMQALTWNISIPFDEKAQPVVVFNPSASPQRTPVRIDVPVSVNESFHVKDSKGKDVPSQAVTPDVMVQGRRGALFVADLPPFGYETFMVYRRQAPEAKSTLTASDTQLESRKYRLAIDKDSGGIAHLIDKEHDFEVFRGLAAVGLVINDKSDTWSHDVVRFNEDAGRFAVTGTRLLEYGPVCASIEVTYAYERSRMTQRFTLYAEMDHIDVDCKVFWAQEHQMLKLVFPVRTVFNRFSYESAFGHTQRGNTGEEYPMHNWVDATGVSHGQGAVYGVGIVSNDFTAASVERSEIRITALRSPVYAHHEPYQLKPDVSYDFMDQGPHRFRYALVPHAGKWEASQIMDLAESMQQPAQVLPETYHEGHLPQSASYLSLDSDQVRMTAFKRAESKEGYVLRLFEAFKSECDVGLNVFGRTARHAFWPE
jgi:alpha-mannosidase